jgi:hypothetical protein
VCVKEGDVNGPEKSRLSGPTEREGAEAREHISLADMASGSRADEQEFVGTVDGWRSGSWELEALRAQY